MIIKNGKDRIAKLEQINVGCKINCDDCDTYYIGHTKRQLKTRINEHNNDVKKHESNFSVVSKHRTQLNYKFNFMSPEILYKEKNRKKREIAEMFFIKKFRNNINLQKDTEGWPDVYDRIIDLTNAS